MTWKGESKRHSMASKGIKTTDLKYIHHSRNLYPYEDPTKFYNWLILRGWDERDALDYIEAAIDNNQEEANMVLQKYMYTNAWDAFNKPSYPKDQASTVYYATRESPWHRDFSFSGYTWDDWDDMDDKQKQKQKEALLRLDFNGKNKSHVNLGQVPFTEPNEIYHNMQGDNWSPLGEARNLVGKNSTHTSMSIGDIIKTPDGKMLIVASFGFLDINELKRRHGI